MTRYHPVVSATSRAVLLLSVVALLLPAQIPAPRPEQQAAPAWLAASRAVLAKESYTAPPSEIRRLVEAPWDLNVALTLPSPNRKYFLNVQEKEFPPVAAYGKAHLYFAGL